MDTSYARMHGHVVEPGIVCFRTEVHRRFIAAPSPVAFFEDKIDESYSSRRLRCSDDRAPNAPGITRLFAKSRSLFDARISWP